ncbi:MAG TPA: sterol desaturase family protein [Caulobacteraceae bacterium]|nr:sterol desaturase family protein [Caulobacteraceae bacterium]
MLMALINLAVLLLAFGGLARVCPCNPGQPSFIGRDLADNTLYWAMGTLLYGDAVALYIHAGAGLFAPHDASSVAKAILGGYGAAARLPLLVQVLLIIVAIDFVQYWVHRLFHREALWPFHAIHHSPVDLDWTATYRNHPVNFLIYSTGVIALVRLAGFSPAAFLIIAPFNMVFGTVVHANLNWTYGPFRYVLASPVYHRWHHAIDPAVRDHNFAPTFPIWDLMFGTYYMPRGALPQEYGVEGVPPHFLAQMVYPFRVYAERFGAWRKASARAAAA